MILAKPSKILALHDINWVYGFVYYKSPKSFKRIYRVKGIIDYAFITVYKERTKLWKDISNHKIKMPLQDELIYYEFNVKQEYFIEHLDTISAQINQCFTIISLLSNLEIDLVIKSRTY